MKEIRRAKAQEFINTHMRSPQERWGTCCPSDPECEHSLLDVNELSAHMNRRISDDEASEYTHLDEGAL